VLHEAGETPLRVFGVEDVLPAGDCLEVGTGAERLVAGTGDDDGPDLRILLRLLQCITDADTDRLVDRVARFGPVDRDDQGVTPALSESAGGSRTIRGRPL
jgi:hypothetical protein